MRDLYEAALADIRQVTPATIGGSRWDDRHWSFCQLWDISPEVARVWLAMDIVKEKIRETQNQPNV